MEKKKKAAGQNRFFLGMFLGLVIFLGGMGLYLFFQAKPITRIREALKPAKITPTWQNPSSFHLPILLYHYVEYIKDKNDILRKSFTIPPYIFDQQIKTLVEAGYTFLIASELADIFDNKMKLPAKPVMITFDDGHWDLATDVLPILQKYNVKATAYIITGFIGGSDFLSPKQLQEVIQSGLIEIGAHTVHHVALKKEPFLTVQAEVFDSKSLLEREYHLSVVSFAYPDGSFDDQAMELVKNTGFRTAVSTLPGSEQNINNRYFLSRERPSYRTGEELLKFLQ